MGKHLLWKEQLQALYFNVLFEYTQSGSYRVIQTFANQLCQLNRITYVAIYLYDERIKKYRVAMASNPFTDTKIFPKLLKESQSHMIESFENVTIDRSLNQDGENSSDWSHSMTVKLEGLLRPTYLLIQFKEKCSQEDIFILKQETEKLLHILFHLENETEANRKNQYLIDLSNDLYSFNITEILTGISRALDGLYPDYTHHIFLVQDVESDHLPIKSFDIHDRSSTSLNTQVLMTGKVQFQVNSHLQRTYLYAPLQGKQGVYGVIELISPDVIYYSEDDIQFITKFAYTAGKAIENAILYQNSNYLVSDLKFLNEMVKELNSNMKISEILSVLKEHIIDTCDASEVGFIYLNHEHEDMSFSILPESTSFFNTEAGYRFASFLVDQINVNQEAILSGDFGFDIDQSFKYRSVMFIPMVQHQTIHGIVAIMHEEMFHFTFENFKLMQSLISHSTLVLINALLNEELEQAVITDYLTKLYSRNYLDDMINYHMALDEQGSLLLFDIDDFKKINDTYGHYVGDQVLKDIADIVKENVGKDDIAARWGGEEFAIYLPHANIEDGVSLAEKIRTHIAKQLDNPPVTISCGVSCWSNQLGSTVEELFIKADMALYEAKEKGKNSIVMKD